MLHLLEKVRFDLYASVMGITGLGLAWRFAAQCFEFTDLIGSTLVFSGFAVYILLSLLNLMRFVIKPALVIDEWKNSDQFNFIPTFTISGSLLACAFLPYSQLMASVIWWPTVLLQVLLIVVAIRRWLSDKTMIQNISPAWLIPMVGNASPCFAGVALGYGSFSYALLMSALACWLIFTPLILGRLILHKPETNLVITPGIAILVSAPAVISVGLFNYPEAAGTLIPLLSYAALLFAVVIFCLFPHFRIRSFSRSLWAFTFPASALASSLLRFYYLSPDPYTRWQAWIGLGVASIIVLLICALAAGDLLAEWSDTIRTRLTQSDQDVADITE